MRLLFVLNITKMYFSGQNSLKVTLSRKTITGTHAPYVKYEIQHVQTVSEAELYVPALYFVVLRQC